MRNIYGDEDSMTSPEDRDRYANQCDSILERLQAGPLLNSELCKMGLNHTARISNLRKEGYDIVCTRVPGGHGLTVYTLGGNAA